MLAMLLDMLLLFEYRSRRMPAQLLLEQLLFFMVMQEEKATSIPMLALFNS
jgi:hypothetical protein